MSTHTANLGTPDAELVLRQCVETLQRIASYRLPAAIDRRLLWLSEHKEGLSDDERAELLALVDLGDQRSLDKVQAQAILKQLSQLYPHLVSAQS